MDKAKVLGVIRHTLTFVGGILVMKGIFDESITEEIIGGLITLIGSIWSVVSKKGGE
jgi:hypothetical protein